MRAEHVLMGGTADEDQSYRDEAEPTAEYCERLRQQYAREVEPYAFVIGARVARIAAGRAALLFAIALATVSWFAPQPTPHWPSHNVLLWFLTPFAVAAILGCGLFVAWLWYRVRVPAAQRIAARGPHARTTRERVAILDRGARVATSEMLGRCAAASEHSPFVGAAALLAVTLVSVGTMIPNFAFDLRGTETAAAIVALVITLAAIFRVGRLWRDVVAFEHEMLAAKVTRDALVARYRDAMVSVAWKVFTVCLVALLLMFPLTLIFDLFDASDCVERGPGACDGVL